MSKQESASSITCETKGKYCLEPGVDYLSNQLPLDTKMITSLDSTGKQGDYPKKISFISVGSIVLEITRRFSDPLVSSLVSTVPSLQATVTNRLFPIRSNLLVSRRERSIDRATEDDDNIISSGVAPLMLHRPSITDSEDSASSLTYEQISPLNRKALNLSNTNNSNIDIGIKKRELIFEGITELIHVIKERMQKEQWTRDLQEYSAEQSMLPEEFVPLNEYLDDSMTRYGSRVIQTLSCSRKRPCWALVIRKI